jgi:hypothetical protein
MGGDGEAGSCLKTDVDVVTVMAGDRLRLARSSAAPERDRSTPTEAAAAAEEAEAAVAGPVALPRSNTGNVIRAGFCTAMIWPPLADRT